MRRWRFTVLLLSFALILGACSAAKSGGGGAGKSTTLRLGYYEDIQSPDPDVAYDIPGLALVNNVYEGLVKYETGDSTTIVPGLATAWTISPDSLTYTFTLRTGVVFHDGTPFDAAAAKASFERRLGMKQGAYYMVQDIATLDAPDPKTLVITLSHPTSAFMDYLASPYGVKMTSPTAIKQHTVKDDFAGDWMNTHDAGTGPYTISEFLRSDRYVLTRWDRWWGPKPYYQTIEFRLVPDSGTQVLMLQRGDLDILHQQPISTVDSFLKRDGFQVQSFNVMLKTWIHLNPHRGALEDPTFRQDLVQAINRDQLVSTFFGSYGTDSTQMYPTGMLDPSGALDNWSYDPSKLTAAVSALPASERTVELVYLSGHGADIQRIAQAIQSQLSATGLQVTVREVTVSELFSYPGKDPTTVPDMFVGTENPDSAHPDTWARPYMYKGGGLNYMAGDVPEADQQIDLGLSSVDHSAETAAYIQAGDLLHQAATFYTIADNKDVFIARAGITGFQHWLAIPTALDFAQLKGA